MLKTGLCPKIKALESQLLSRVSYFAIHLIKSGIFISSTALEAIFQTYYFLMDLILIAGLLDCVF